MKTQKTPAAIGNYSAQYKDPRWQKKRLEIMQRDEFTCQRCGSVDTTLNVHHLYYTKGAKIWEYDDRALVTLCETCHEYLHSELNFFNLVIRSFLRNTATNSGIQLNRLSSFLSSLSDCDTSATLKAFDHIEGIMYLIVDERRNGYYDHAMECEK